MNKRALRHIGAGFLMLLLAAYPALSYAHSGRTDSSGGHRDNKNKSGLGSYHYHCGGHPAHLHKNGTCPYSSGGSSSRPASSQSSKKSSEAKGSASSEEILSLISDAVRQGVVTPSIDSDTGGETVNILLGYAKKTVNVRQKPDADSAKIGSIIKDEKIMVIQENYVPRWHQVLYDGQIGYISSKYCDLTGIITKTIPVSER